ncbi:MAG: hypothetical protein P4M11_13940 [Candidatus Pacebacteria bacterium]|nr:hypothetical protein [Candidatus Paceibacterota bacterium]
MFGRVKVLGFSPDSSSKRAKSTFIRRPAPIPVPMPATSPKRSVTFRRPCLRATQIDLLATFRNRKRTRKHQSERLDLGRYAAAVPLSRRWPGLLSFKPPRKQALHRASHVGSGSLPSPSPSRQYLTARLSTYFLTAEQRPYDSVAPKPQKQSILQLNVLPTEEPVQSHAKPRTPWLIVASKVARLHPRPRGEISERDELEKRKVEVCERRQMSRTMHPSGRRTQVHFCVPTGRGLEPSEDCSCTSTNFRICPGVGM